MVKKIPETLALQDHPPKIADLIIGCLYLACFTFGLPNNVSSLCFFARRCARSRRSVTTYLYSLTSLQDTIISILALYSGLILLRDRDPWDPTLCSVHFILFVVSERMSVCLVALLSMSRTYTLVYPMRRIKVKSVLIWLATIWVLVASTITLPILLGAVNIEFDKNTGYCRIEAIDSILKRALVLINMLAIATPIIPILVSCVMSIKRVKKSQRTKFGSIKLTKNCRKKIRKTNHQMTMTIILVALLFVLLKTPLLLNYFLYLITVLFFSSNTELFFSSSFMKYYSWNIAFMLCTALNTCTNPVIYITRFKRYRKWVKKLVRCKRQIGAESTFTGAYFMSSRMFELGHTEYRSNIIHSTIVEEVL
ncbi:psychosine receptor-like [Bolinopsis microptera]|uniref:psychosine receptor-like n=1 Tax=Bolinopsis microptera TaxID=2820187 RepID=UPI003078B192